MKRLSGFHPTVLALFAGVISLTSVAWGEVAKLNSIRLEKSPTSATYTIEYSGTVQHQDFLMSDPPRLVVDLMGVQNGLDKPMQPGDGHLVMEVRTSQFQSDPDMVTRVVFDMAKGVRYKLDRNDDGIKVSFFGADAQGADQKAAQPNVMGAGMAGDAGIDAWSPPVKSNETSATSKSSETPAKTTPNKTSTTTTSKESSGTTTPPKTPETPAQAQKWPPEDEAPATMAWNPAPSTSTAAPDATTPGATKTKTPKPDAIGAAPASDKDVLVASNKAYGQQTSAIGVASTPLSNKTMTMDIQGADIQTVLRSISEFSGANIVAGPDVEGAINVHLVNVPWQQALDTILRSNGYSYKQEYGIYRVDKVKNLQQEEIDQVSLALKKEQMAPLVSRVVYLSFANAKEIADAMKKVVTQRGSVEVEEASNAVVINDIAANIDRVAAMCKDLDREVSQVEIVAKLVDVDFEAAREMGIKWDYINTSDQHTTVSGNTGLDLAEPFGTFTVSTVHSWGSLASTLEILEKKNKANIVSHPRIVTADNREANILVGKEIPLIVSDEAGNPITELKKIGVMLRVTPHVNSDKTITMDLHPEVSELSSEATVQGGVIISLTSADTRVIVQDGETAVIGGLVSEVESSNDQGLPILMDVPVLGNLFKYSNRVKRKRELIIFITPQIVK